MMIRLGVIGLGTISPIQFKALSHLDGYYQVTAVCDVLPEKTRIFEESSFFQNGRDKPVVYNEGTALFDDPNVDAILIATSPASHYALAYEGLEHGKHILLEKPAVLDYQQLNCLYSAAADNSCLLHIAYHASFARDLEWFLLHFSDFELGDITRIECGFFDPYMENGHVIPGKKSLGGCFIDSGVNALSVCEKLVDLTGFQRVLKNEQLESIDTDCVYHADHVFSNGECEIIIHTGWDLGLNQKTTRIAFSNSEDQVLLDHSNQSVVLLGKSQETKLYYYDATERLLTHYIGVFRDFSRAYQSLQSNEKASKAIHRLLLEV